MRFCVWRARVSVKFLWGGNHLIFSSDALTCGQKAKCWWHFQAADVCKQALCLASVETTLCDRCAKNTEKTCMYQRRRCRLVVICQRTLPHFLMNCRGFLFVMSKNESAKTLSKFIRPPLFLNLTHISPPSSTKRKSCPKKNGPQNLVYQ